MFLLNRTFLLMLISCFKLNYAFDHPHIIFILADDLGWNDVSFHGSDQIPTPNIDALGYGGVILNRHYSQPLCTPSRAALLTGKYPIHTGAHWAFLNSQKTGLPLTEKILPQYLKEMGYSTHLVGKWHLGFYEKHFTPVERGFDSHFGYWGGMISYYDHVSDDLYPTNYNESIFSGHDMRRNYDSAWDIVGEYATDLFTKEAVQVIQNHPVDKPMFLYMAHLAAHAGNEGKLLEAPQEEVNRFSYIRNSNRRTYAAMVSKLDKSVGDILEALGKKGMLKNSIVVFASDNGAPNVGHFRNWGSNYPLRGQKATLWEGGVRTPAVVWSPLIKTPHRVSNALMHITDWLPTLLAAAGNTNEPTGLDGVNQWRAISMDLPSSRESLVLDISEHFDISGLIMESLKLIKGATPNPHLPAQSGFLNIDTIFSKKTPSYNEDKIMSSKAWVAIQDFSASFSLKDKISLLRKAATVKCSDTHGALDCEEKSCLFDIISDPCEQRNIASMYPILTANLETFLNSYKYGMVPDLSLFLDPKANPDLFNGTWSIWSS